MITIMTVIEDRYNKASGRVLLPDHVVPIRYDLDITPDFDAFVFHSTIFIEFKVNHDKVNDTNGKEITLHAKELCIASAQYEVVERSNTEGIAEAGVSVPADEIIINVKATTVKFIFEQSFQNATKIRVKIQYTGFLNNEMAGFYRSSYTDISGNKQIMISTQFESLDARRALPCVDEPGVKAVFGVTFIVATKYNVLSNMPEKSIQSLSATEKRITFLDTPIMSTYLLAFCVGEFDSIQGLTDHGVLVRVYTPPGKSDHGSFALDVAIRCLDAYDNFFGTHFPLPKLDMIAIPEFAAGAMENWGLVTYREVDMLIDPMTASCQQKQRVAVIVAHELAHQWFGNLVTMQWWDDLWLNEGFASWVENYGVDLLFPEYYMWDQVTIDHLASALRLDALRSSHPIQVPIHHAEEVEQVFDAISYDKGCCVIRMIKAVLGMHNFQQGLSNYMHKFAYSNTETLDLWTAWEEVSKIPVLDMMASWTEQMGFPLLRVTKEDWQNDKVILELEQNWFLADGSELKDEEKAKKWTIPIMTATDQGNQSDMTIMREKTACITIPLSNSTGSWIKLNANHEVPMRVLGTPEMLKRLASAIGTKQLHRVDRSGLLNDTYAVVKAGYQAPTILMELIGNYRDEDEYVVWEALASVLNGLDTVLSNEKEMSDSFRSFVKPIVLNLMKKVGWQPQSTDEHLTSLLRAIMISLVGKFAYDNEEVVTEAKKRYAAFQNDANDVTNLPADIRPQVFSIILKNGGEAEYKSIKSYYNTAESNAEKKHVLNSLGAIRDPKLKLDTMEWSISGEIKLQDFFYVMGSVGRSSNGGNDISWKFLKDNLSRIKDFVGAGASASVMDAVIVTCAGNFSSNERADEIQEFFNNNPLPRNSRKIEQMIENMRSNAKFLDALKASELSQSSYWTRA